MGVELARQPPSQDDSDRVGQADQFVEVGGDEQHGKTFAACVLDVIPDRGLRADVDTSLRALFVRATEDNVENSRSRSTRNSRSSKSRSHRMAPSSPTNQSSAPVAERHNMLFDAVWYQTASNDI